MSELQSMKDRHAAELTALDERHRQERHALKKAQLGERLDLVVDAIHRAGGSRTEAAKIIGLRDRRQIHKYIENYGLDVPPSPHNAPYLKAAAE